MKQLISSAEVITLAFGSATTLREERVPAHTILAAQHRLVRPVVGERVYEMITRENTTEECERFVEESLKLPLALYVASLLLPSLALQVGSVGVVMLSGESFEAADGDALRRASQRMRADADALMDAAIERLAVWPELGELYSSGDNVRQRVSLLGGVVL